MRIQDTDIWNDPIVQETIACIGEVGEITGGGDVNDNPIIKVMLETGGLDPLAVAAVMAGENDSLFHRGMLPASVQEVLELARATRVREEGPEHIFAARNASALRVVLAEFTSEVTGEAYQKLLNRPDFSELREHIDAGAQNVVALCDGLIETGLLREMPPKLLDKFIESMENVRFMVETSVLKRGVASAIQSLKLAIAETAAEEIAAVAPRIDPSSQYEQMKQVAKTKFRVK
jgi:hypothetical protein